MQVDPVQVFRALGHPARLAIVDELSRGERTVAELVAVVGSSWSTVSRHLAALRGAGLVAGERRGNQIACTLALPCVATFTRCVQAAAHGQHVELRTCCG